MKEMIDWNNQKIDKEWCAVRNAHKKSVRILKKEKILKKKILNTIEKNFHCVSTLIMRHESRKMRLQGELIRTLAQIAFEKVVLKEYGKQHA